MHSRFVSAMSDLSAQDWHALARNTGPFLRYEFLQALEQTGCVGEGTGWQPYHWVVEDEGRLVAAMPGYLKTHSYGEYVFDHAWANAYHQYGREYYPKWISAAPFTPVTAARLLSLPQTSLDELQPHLTASFAALRQRGYSSAHILFPAPAQLPYFKSQGFLTRHSVQFQWHNYGYQCFEDFAATLTSRKRKSMRRARAALQAQGIGVEQRLGPEISDEEWQFFIRCYQQTYLKRSGHSGYLSAAFFEQIRAQMAEQILLVIAYQQQTPVASALFFYDANGLYGRYWGCLKEIDQLHFECCYFQGIEFAIAQQLPIFNPGTQGEHKLLRGFEPLYCVSLHQLFAAEFHHAVEDFLTRETAAVIAYYQDAMTVLPFNQESLTRLSVYHPAYTPEGRQ